jgi:peptidyl-prolyl cis-trans isomerase D
VLQSIRDKSQSWLVVAIIVVIILTFALWGVQRIFVSGSSEAVVAKVNGTKITQRQLANAYQHSKQQWQQQLGAKFFSQPDLAKQLKQSALESLVNEAVLVNALNKQHFAAAPSQLGQAVASIPAFQENGKFSSARFQQILASMGYTEDQFLQQIKSTMMQNQLRAGIVGTAFALPNEIASASAFASQQRQFSYLIVDAKDFIAKTQVSDQQVQQYYQQNQKDYQLPEKISISYIELSPQAIARTIQPTTQQLQQYYQENQSRFNGKTYDQVASQVKAAYVQAQTQKIMTSKTTELGNLTLEQPGSLQSAAKALNLTVESTDLFTRQGEKTGILKNPSVVSAAFGDTVLNQKSNSDVITLSDNSVVVLRLKQQQAAAVKPLSQVSATIKTSLQQQQADKLAQQYSQSIVTAIEKGDTTTNSQQQAVSWQQSGFITQQNTKLNHAVISKAFLLPLPTKTQASVAVVQLSNQQYAVVKLDTVRAGQAATNKTLASTIVNDKGQTAYSLYQSGLLKQAKIKYYQQNIEAVQ